jgi:putative endonuclease
MGKAECKLGQLGEQYMVDRLSARGIPIVARNIRWHKHGEIDVIFWDKEVLVCLEVKTRWQETVPFGEQISRYKQQCLIRTARWFIQRYRNVLQSAPVRFDVAFLEWRHSPPKLTYIKEAFHPWT